MSTNLISVRSFLGKYYAELLHSTLQDKYKSTGLDNIFEQRFYIQNNRVQMIIDPSAVGLSVVINGNEIHISKDLYDHPSVTVNNSLEHNQYTNPRSLYNPSTFSTISYLICQNHLTFSIVGEIEEPIYIRYTGDYETFYNSVFNLNLETNTEVEIVEEIESLAALNAVSNYELCPHSTLKLTTFYKNRISATSTVYRNIVARESSIFSHIVFGRGSSEVVDENKIQTFSDSKSEFYGIVHSAGRSFNSILSVEPSTLDYSIDVDYRDVLNNDGIITFMPLILGTQPDENLSSIKVSSIDLREIPSKLQEPTLKDFLTPIIDRATLDRMVGVKRFYENKSKFLNFQTTNNTR